MNILILLLIILIPSIVNGEVVFSTDFDSTPDWKPVSGGTAECGEGDCSAVVPDGWSYYKSGGRYNSSGSAIVGEDTVRINNDNYRGTSGKGFTFWAESAPAWSNDGMIAVVFPGGIEYQGLYLGIQIKFSSTWVWDSSADGIMKLMRMGNWDGTGTIFSYFSTGASEMINLILLKHSNLYGWKHYPAIRCNPKATNYSCDQDYDQDSDFPGAPTFKESLGDGNWHNVILYGKPNTVSGATYNHDGVMSVWIDGVLSYTRSDIQWKTDDPTGAMGWNYVEIGGNHNNIFTDETSGDEQWYAIDDVVVATTLAEALAGPPSSAHSKMQGIGGGGGTGYSIH